MFFFLSRLLLLYFLSSEKSNYLDDDYDELGTDPGSSGRYFYCPFSLRFDNFVFGVLGSDVFAPIGVESKGGIYENKVFVPTGVEAKLVDSLHSFGAQILYVLSKFPN